MAARFERQFQSLRRSMRRKRPLEEEDEVTASPLKRKRSDDANVDLQSNDSPPPTPVQVSPPPSAMRLFAGSKFAGMAARAADGASDAIEDLDLFYFRQLAISLKSLNEGMGPHQKCPCVFGFERGVFTLKMGLPFVRSVRRAATFHLGMRKYTEDDYDIQQKIDLEIKMREGTTKLLAACKREAQTLEAAKNLLTSDARVLAYMAELQKRKSEEYSCKRTTENGGKHTATACKGKVSVSDIRIPLLWGVNDHIKNKGDHHRYAVFCLVRIGHEIFDTSLVTNIDRTETDVNFDDTIVFENVSSDFTCTLEVYSYNLHNDMTIASTPQKIRRKINSFSNSVGRSMGRKLQATLSNAGLHAPDNENQSNKMPKGPKFSLVARTKLRLEDINVQIKTHDLELEKDDSTPHQLPLFGNFCCRLAAQPHSMNHEVASGFLDVQEVVCGLPNWRRLWCTLRESKIAVWRNPEDVGFRLPNNSISITKDTTVSLSEINNAKRPYMFAILCRNNDEQQRHLFSAENESELEEWMGGFQQLFVDIGSWKHACLTRMHIRTPLPRRATMDVPRPRKGSLYDEMTIKRLSFNSFLKLPFDKSKLQSLHVKPFHRSFSVPQENMHQNNISDSDDDDFVFVELPGRLPPPRSTNRYRSVTVTPVSQMVTPSISVTVSPATIVNVSPATSVRVSPSTSVRVSPATSGMVSPVTGGMVSPVTISPVTSGTVSPVASVATSPETSPSIFPVPLIVVRKETNV